MDRRTILTLTVAISAVAAATALSAFASSQRSAPAPASYLDRYATVQLRHDVLGLKTDAGLVINDAITAARASITGKFLSAGEQFVVLEVQHEEVWIPRDNVLLIHFRER